MSGLSKYEKMKKNLKKNNIITDGDRKQRDRIMKEDSEKLKGEIIQAERYNIKEIIEDSKEDKEIVNKRISEEREITEILKELILKQDYSNEAVREALNKKPELFQNLDMVFIKEKIEELLIIKEERRKYDAIVMKAKEEVEKAKKRYNFLM
jgi:hypothetical protein